MQKLSSIIILNWTELNWTVPQVCQSRQRTRCACSSAWSTSAREATASSAAHLTRSSRCLATALSRWVCWRGTVLCTVVLINSVVRESDHLVLTSSTDKVSAGEGVMKAGRLVLMSSADKVSCTDQQCWYGELYWPGMLTKWVVLKTGHFECECPISPLGRILPNTKQTNKTGNHKQIR